MVLTQRPGTAGDAVHAALRKAWAGTSNLFRFGLIDKDANF